MTQPPSQRRSRGGSGDVPGRSAGFAPHAIALTAVALAVGARLLLNPVLGQRFPFALLFFAVLVAAWKGGLRPALLATLAGAAAASWLWILPGLEYGLSDAEALAGLALYLTVGCGIGMIGGRMRSAELRATKALGEAEKRKGELEVTLGSIGDGVISTDRDGRVTWLNDVARELTGWSPGDAVGQPLGAVFRIFNQVTGQPVENPVEKVLRDGRSVALANHTILVSRTGKEIPIDDSAAPILSSEGQMLGVVLVFRDDTKRRDIETQLEISERQLRELFESASVGIEWIDAEGRIVRANRYKHDLLGFSREQYLGKPLVSFFADPGEFRQLHSRLERGEQIVDARATFRTRDGAPRQVLLYATGALEQGKLTHSSWLSLDLSGRLRQDEAQALLAAVVEASEDAIIVKSLDGVVRAWNAGAERLFHYAASDIVGRPVSILIPPERHDEEMRAIGKVSRGERVPPFETVRLTRGGVRVHVSLALSPIRGRNGVITGASSVARDISARKHAENRIRTLAAIVEGCNEAVILYDADLRVTFMNEAAKRMVGLEGEVEATGVLLRDCFWAEDWHLMESTALPTLEHEGRWAGEIRLRHFTTYEPIHTIWNASVIRDESGVPVARVAVSPDLRKLKAAEQALIESQAELSRDATALRRLHELSSMLLQTTDRDAALDEILVASVAMLGGAMGHIHLVDPATGSLELVAQIGFRPASAAALSDESGLPGAPHWRAFQVQKRVLVEDVAGDPGERALLDHAREAGYRAVLATPLILGRGSCLGVLSTYFARPQLPNDSQIRYFDLYLRLAADFVERQRNEEILREREEQFRLLADKIAHSAWMADGKGKIVWCNERWKKFAADPTTDTGIVDWRDRIHPAEEAQCLEGFQQNIERGEQWEGTVPLLGADGRYRWFLSAAVPIRDSKGRVLRWFGTHTDITIQRKAEEELQTLDRRKDAFLATLAHELRNPLAPLKTSLELLGHPEIEGRNRVDLLAVMGRQLTHLQRLVDDLLDVTRINQDKLRLRQEEVDLSRILHQVAADVTPLAEASGLELVKEIPEDPILLSADGIRIAQIFWNLLTNAVKYTDRGGWVRFSCRRVEDHVEIKVADNGRGIPAELLEKIFETYFQVEQGKHQIVQGLGLGLALVRRLVELHGGKVSAASPGPGLGSTFVVELPLVSTGGAPPGAQGEVEGSPSARSRRILVVDDNFDAAATLGELLSLCGHEVHLAHDGSEALDVARRVEPEIVLLDIGLPGQSGHEVARQIRDLPWGQKARLVALTGWGQAGDYERSRAAGFDEHIVKPVDLATLESIIGRAGPLP